MLRICIVLTLALAALWSYAYADDDWGDGQSDVIRVEKAPAETAPAPAEHNHAAPPDAAGGAPVPPSGNLGAYFGAGDVFLWSGAESDVTAGEQPGGAAPDQPIPPAYSAPPDAAHMPHPQSELKGTESADGSADDATGPLWGMPEGTAGVEGDTQPAADGDVIGNGKTHQHEETASGDEEGNSKHNDIRNHKVNREDPNDW